MKKLSEFEIGKRLLALAPGKSFAVSTATERGIATSLIRAFKMAGKLDGLIVKSREDEQGQFIFYIAQ